MDTRPEQSTINGPISPEDFAKLSPKEMVKAYAQLHQKYQQTHSALGEALTTAAGSIDKTEKLEENLEGAKKEITALQKTAMLDPLTGLLNRRALEVSFNKGLAHAKRENHQQPPDNSKTVIGLLVVDLDHFKHVNDTHGHDVGDEVLKEVAKRLQESVRKEDIVARYGGEEFVILFPMNKPEDFPKDKSWPEHVKEQLHAFAEKIRTNIQENPIGSVKQTATIGISCVNAQAMQGDKVFEEIFKLADAALYEGKEGGRNRVIAFWPKSMEDKKAARNEIKGPSAQEAYKL